MTTQRDMLRICRDQFSMYGKSHRAKNTAEATVKAEVNEQLVRDIDEVLSQPDEVGGIEGIVAFAQIAYADGVSDRNRQTQLGVHFEEQAELLETISGRDVITSEILGNAESALKHLAEHLKNTPTTVYAINDRLGFLDALCDQAVPGTLTAVLHNFDITSGLQEVNRSNASKLINGVMEKDPTTFKWIKGPNYSAPNLKPFI